MVNSKFEELLGKTAIEGTQKIMKGVKKKDDEDEEEEEEDLCINKKEKKDIRSNSQNMKAKEKLKYFIKL